jgi:hypothetical protein
MFAPRGWLKRPVARRIYRTIAASDLFDARWYRSTQVSGLASLMDPLWHYLDHGAAVGLDPSPVFDTSHYVHTNHDVRSSGLNPLFHYLEYGRAEHRSSLRSVVGTRDVLLPETAELETFTSPQTGSPRVTLVVDSRSEVEHSRSLADIIDAAQNFAEKKSRTLRVIAWPNSGDLNNAALKGAVVIEARRSHPAPTFDSHSDELFIASSSSSALSLRHVAPLSQLWKLTSGKSLALEPWAAAPSLEDFVAQKSSDMAGRGIPRSGRVAMALSKDKETVILFADAVGDPISYLRALELLDQLFLEDSGLGNEWNVVVCGRGVEPLMLAGEVPVSYADHVSRRTIAEMSVAIMATSDQQVQGWCKESGVAVVTDISGSSISGALFGGRA